MLHDTIEFTFQAKPAISSTRLYLLAKVVRHKRFGSYTGSGYSEVSRVAAVEKPDLKTGERKLWKSFEMTSRAEKLKRCDQP